MGYRWFRSQVDGARNYYANRIAPGAYNWNAPYISFRSKEDYFFIGGGGHGKKGCFDFPREIKTVRNKRKYALTIFRLEGHKDE